MLAYYLIVAFLISLLFCAWNVRTPKNTDGSTVFAYFTVGVYSLVPIVLFIVFRPPSIDFKLWAALLLPTLALILTCMILYRRTNKNGFSFLSRDSPGYLLMPFVTS